MVWAASLVEEGLIDADNIPSLRSGLLQLYAWNSYFQIGRCVGPSTLHAHYVWLKLQNPSAASSPYIPVSENCPIWAYYMPLSCSLRDVVISMVILNLYPLRDNICNMELQP